MLLAEQFAKVAPAVTPDIRPYARCHHGPLSSLRLEAYRMGLEDRALLALLEADDRMDLSERLVRGATDWTLDGKVLEQARRDAAGRIGTMQC